MNQKSILSAFLLLACTGAAWAAALIEAPSPARTKMPAVNPADYGDTATVNLLVETNAYGYVTAAEVKDASHPALGQACVEAIRQWRYSPAREYGQPVPAKFIQPFRFSDGLITTTATVDKPASKAPKATHRVAPELPQDLRAITGSAIVSVGLDAEGKIVSVAIDDSTHEELNSYCEAAVRQWRFSPNLVDGQAVPCTVQVPFRFKGDPLRKDVAAKAMVVDNRDLKPLRQPSPVIPAALAKAVGEAEVAFIVDEHGFVNEPEIRSSTQPELGEIARQTVLNWKYRPALKDGEAVAVKVLQPFRFNGGMVVTQSRALVDKLPSVRQTAKPEIPDTLRGIAGYVNVQFAIDAEGNVTAVEAKTASLAELEAPALEAAKNWKFKPALKDGVATASTVVVPFVFGK